MSKGRDIETQKMGKWLDAKKGNEIIRALNALQNIKVVLETGRTNSEVTYTDNDVTIKLPRA